MTDRTITTEAGRRLAAQLGPGDPRRDPSWPDADIAAVETEAAQRALDDVRAKVEALRVEDCPDCNGYGWVAETTADPDEDGQLGEPYQVQAVCDHRAMFLAALQDRGADR